MITYNLVKTLHIAKGDGTKIALKIGDSVYLKLDFQHMKLWDQEIYLQRYPDGWVEAEIFHVTDSCKTIRVELKDFFGGRYLQLNQRDILDVSIEAPKK